MADDGYETVESEEKVFGRVTEIHTDESGVTHDPEPVRVSLTLSDKTEEDLHQDLLSNLALIRQVETNLKAIEHECLDSWSSEDLKEMKKDAEEVRKVLEDRVYTEE